MYAVAVGAALTLAALAGAPGGPLVLAMALSVCLPLLALGRGLPSPLSPPAPTSAAHGGPGAPITVPSMPTAAWPTPQSTIRADKAPAIARLFAIFSSIRFK
ncbi:MAG: hypothetical protein JWP59_2002 [Massilia sp.]|nr:hypothetical protein [Massilia sp.]